MLRYLALGDSYTIGEGLPEEESFPFQSAKLLREHYNLSIQKPKIIAKTGWTTDELLLEVEAQRPLKDFDLVSLLIGVNNQYRKYELQQYQTEFRLLLELAISFAKGNNQKVFVLSIPDWGKTPFAVERNPEEISRQIQVYNKINEDITKAFACNYVNITKSTQENGSKPSFLVEDLLHYNAKEYSIWAELLSKHMIQKLN